MQLKTFFKAAVKLFSKKNAITSVPLSFMLLGLQALMDVQFSCPCKMKWNALISSFVFIVPALFSFVIMLMFLRPCKYKCSLFQGQDRFGNFHEVDKNETSREQGKGGRSQVQNEREKSPAEETKPSFETVLMACLIPPIVWICMAFIDGDYLACAATDWNGQYACNKELHPICVNWCKPNELSQGGNETELYEQTRERIDSSKFIGYSLAFAFCIIAIIIVSVTDCSRGPGPACCKSACPGSGDHRDLLTKSTKKQSEKHKMGTLEEDTSTRIHLSQVLDIEENV